MKTQILQKSAVGVTLLCWLIFLWLHTFVRVASFSTNKGEWGYLIPAVITLLATFLYTNAAICLKNIFLESNANDDEWDKSFLQNRNIENRKTNLLSKSLLGVLILAVLFLVVLILEVWIPDFVFYTDRTYISIGAVEINRKYMYEPCLLIFCMFTQLIFEGMKIQKYRCISVVSGCFQIIALSMMEFLLFMTLPNIWLIEIAFINIITIVTAVWKYVWGTCEKKGNVVALVILYVTFWVGLLSLFGYPEQTIVQYIYGGDWREYAGNVQFLLLENAKVFGAMPELQSNIQMQEFMSNRSNYLHNVLCYFGWGMALLVIVILVVFLFSTRIMLGKNGKYHKNYLIYNAAWWTIALRVIIGIPYSMGLLPIPIGLPLSGDISLYMDTMAIAVLIWCSFENREIDFVLSYTLMDKDEYIAEKNEIVVTRPKSEELYMGSFDTVDECLDDVDEDDISESEDVIYKSGNFEIPCSIQCLRYLDRKFGVFDPINNEHTKVFILEFSEETNMWIAVGDEKLCERIIHKSLMRYIEDCMEEAE